MEEVASKLGVSRYVISHTENGKITTPIAVYVGLLWAYGLLDQFSELADPASDKEGLALSLANDRAHARRVEALDNDF
jgi:transcriptional regulator with XRE-family HTH domain